MHHQVPVVLLSALHPAHAHTGGELHHLQHLGIEDQLFIAGRQPAVHPACRVFDQMRAAGDSPPQRHLAFVSRLRIDGIGRGGKAREEVLEIRSLNNAKAARAKKGKLTDLGFKPSGVVRME